MLTNIFGLPSPLVSPATFKHRLPTAVSLCASSLASSSSRSSPWCLQAQQSFSTYLPEQRRKAWPACTAPARKHLLSCQAASGPQSNSSEQDANQLVTQLNNALAQEDYARASQLRDKLKAVQGSSDSLADWREYGCPDWLAERAEKLGFRFPTGVLSRLLGHCCSIALSEYAVSTCQASTCSALAGSLEASLLHMNDVIITRILS